MIKAFDVFDTLPFLSVIIAVAGIVFTMAHGDDRAILVSWHAEVTAQEIANEFRHDDEK